MVTGDWQKLRLFKGRVERLGGNVLPRLVRVVGRAALEELREGFAGSRGADGTGWPSTTEGRKPLVGFGKHWRLVIAGGALRLTSDHPGARAHNYGATIVPKNDLKALKFTIGGRTVFARKVRLPKRRATPKNGSLQGWAPRLRKVAVDELAAILEVGP